MGEEQRIAYERQLEKAMESLLEFPEWGMVTNDVGTGIRAVPCGQHRISYRIDDDSVRIIRVLNVRMDVTGQFGS